MTLLLDTHVLLWALMAPQRLSPGLRAALTQPDTRVQFSAASVWEIAIRLGNPSRGKPTGDGRVGLSQ